MTDSHRARPFIALTPGLAHALRVAADFEQEQNRLATMLGLPVVVSSHLQPSEAARAGIDGRRIARHGLADVLEWLGEEVGPKPGDPVPVMALVGNIADRFPGTRIEWESQVDRGHERMTARFDLPLGVTPADAFRVVTGC